MGSMSTAWIISDPHFGHGIASRERGFTSPAEHDRWLLDLCSRRFQPGDDVWWLGDIAFDGWRDRLPNTIGAMPAQSHHLVLGNHDRPHPLNRNGHAYAAEYLQWFSTVQMAAKLRWEGREVVLSHFPYDGDHTREERYDEWRMRDRGITLIHGHTHSAEKFSRSKSGTLQIHAGVDAWRAPVALSTLLLEAEAWIKARSM